MGKMMVHGVPYGGLTDKVPYTSSDIADTDVTVDTGWTTVDPLVTGETNQSIFTKLSQMFKNVRWLNKKCNTMQPSIKTYTDTFNGASFDITLTKIGYMVFVSAKGANPQFASNTIYAGTTVIPELSHMVAYWFTDITASTSNRPKQYHGTMTRTTSGNDYVLAMRTCGDGWTNGGSTQANLVFLSDNDDPLV